MQPQIKVSEQELAAITQAVLDYIEGGYNADTAQMERSLHPELAKRAVMKVPDQPDRLSQMSALSLLQVVGKWQPKPADLQQKDITIFDATPNSASVKLVSQEWVDYLHLAKYNNKWLIVNVLWEFKEH